MRSMVELTPRQAKLLLKHVRQFAAQFRAEVADVVATHFRGVQPAEVRELLEQVSILERQLEVKKAPVQVHEVHCRLLRRILIDERRRAAEAIDGPLRMAMDRHLAGQLRSQLVPIELLMEASWFAHTEALPLPRLTDYMSVHHAEQVLDRQLKLAPREYDEKFHILEAPGLFWRDMPYYRRKCALRDASLVVGYADIDDFKRLNSRYTETRVDLDVLGPLMGAIEAHMFAHGHAYRFGGDEYVLLLPNAGSAEGARFLGSLQRRLAKTSYRGVQERPTMSIGYVVVDRDTVLTDREVLSAANRAKNAVKQHDKGGLATFDGMLFRDEDLRVLPRPAKARASAVRGGGVVRGGGESRGGDEARADRGESRGGDEARDGSEARGGGSGESRGDGESRIRSESRGGEARGGDEGKGVAPGVEVAGGGPVERSEPAGGGAVVVPASGEGAARSSE